jgi:hypothetical protein
MTEKRALKISKSYSLNGDVSKSSLDSSRRMKPAASPAGQVSAAKTKEEEPLPLEITISSGIHSASSLNWGESACAKLFSNIIEFNDGMAQQIIENKTYFLQLYTKEELQRTDDLGLSLPFVAVYHDRPDMLRYLFVRGLDLSAPCDPMGFGNPMFYAVTWRKYRVVDVLDLLGVSVTSECDMFKQTPMAHAERLDDPIMIALINNLKGRNERVRILFEKNFQRAKCRRMYRIARVAIINIQRIMRGKLARMKAASKRKKLRAKLKKENALREAALKEAEATAQEGPAVTEPPRSEKKSAAAPPKGVRRTSALK